MRRVCRSTDEVNRLSRDAGSGIVVAKLVKDIESCSRRDWRSEKGEAADKVVVIELGSIH